MIFMSLGQGRPHLSILTLPGEDWSPPGKRPSNSTRRIWMDNIREDLKGKNIRKLPGLVKRPKTKTKKKPGGVLLDLQPHRRHSRRKRRKRERESGCIK